MLAPWGVWQGKQISPLGFQVWPEKSWAEPVILACVLPASQASMATTVKTTTAFRVTRISLFLASSVEDPKAPLSSEGALGPAATLIQSRTESNIYTTDWSSFNIKLGQGKCSETLGTSFRIGVQRPRQGTWGFRAGSLGETVAPQTVGVL
jgi:hypothetical protein